MSDHNKMLIDRIKGMPAQPGDLSEEIGWLLEEIDEQKDELDRLRAEVATWKDRAIRGREIIAENYPAMEDADTQITHLRAEVSEWKMKYESEVTLVDNVEAELDRLRTRNAKLEDALKMIVAGGYDEASRVFAAEVAARALAPAPPKETEG